MPLSGGPRVQSLMLTLIACLFAGCTSEPLISRQALVGNYVYKSQDPEGKASDHEWDRLTLDADGKYDLVQGGPTKTKSEKTGSWSFTGGDPAQVMLDHAGYPIRVKGSEVRLMIDYDTGIWYAKSK
jgi:hypothetical protein